MRETENTRVELQINHAINVNGRRIKHIGWRGAGQGMLSGGVVLAVHKSGGHSVRYRKVKGRFPECPRNRQQAHMWNSWGG